MHLLKNPRSTAFDIFYSMLSCIFKQKGYKGKQCLNFNIIVTEKPILWFSLPSPFLILQISSFWKGEGTEAVMTKERCICSVWLLGNKCIPLISPYAIFQQGDSLFPCVLIKKFLWRQWRPSLAIALVSQGFCREQDQTWLISHLVLLWVVTSSQLQSTQCVGPVSVIALWEAWEYQCVQFRSSLFGLSLQSSLPTLSVAIVFQKAASCENGLASPNYNSSLFCCQENSIISYLDYTKYYRIKTTTEMHCYFSFLISCLVTGIPPPAKFFG